jgi:hypothetical protein
MKHKNGFKPDDFIRRQNGKVVYKILSFGNYRGGDTIVLQTESQLRYEIRLDACKYILVDANGNELTKVSDLFPIY